MKHIRLADGTRLAYTLSGEPDGPTVALLDGISCDGFIWPYLQPALERHFRVLHLHYRGHGLSGLPREPQEVTLPYLARDIDRVADELELGPMICVGHSMGCQVILELAWRYPKRVRAGILLCGSGGRLLDTFKGTDLGKRLMPMIKAGVERFDQVVGRAMRFVVPSELAYQVAAWTEPNRALIRREDLMPYLSHMATMPPRLFVRLLDDASDRTSQHFLARLKQPMLVVSGEQDGFTPAWASEMMNRQLPNGTLEMLPEGTHTAPLELPGRLEQIVRTFLEREGLFGRAKPRLPRRPESLARRFRRAARARR